MRKLFCLVLCLSLFGCGGGGSDDPIATIAGTWSGLLQQASSIRCSDGSVITAGVGVDTRAISFTVTGGSEIGTIATLILDDCLYTGAREASRELVFSSSEVECAESVTLSAFAGNDAMIYIADRVPEPPEDGSLLCSIDESGTVVRTAG